MKQTQTIFITVFACAFLVGIFFGIYTAGKDNSNTATPIVIFGCDNSKSMWVAFGENTAQISLSNGQFITVQQTESASGARYANEDSSFVFWNKDNEAFIEQDGEITHENCIAR